MEGYVDVTYGAYDQVRLEGAVGGPLSENILGRLSAMYNRHDGYLKNGCPEQTYVPADLEPGLDNGLPQPAGAGSDLGNDDTWAVRGQLLFKLSDTVDLLVTGFGTEPTMSVSASSAADRSL
ncbi:hypothetical protein [Luteithermobacter gelatinilyticus]|uniref:hypothetical protein n=1 Tax=Luteithermobacter gelatinilyticus TaxID=2582913 RepID=UPI001105DC50|nr:hypothetical protein [Luteithermobacter gelatinilyticus]